jgi:hypothetical protein
MNTLEFWWKNKILSPQENLQTCLYLRTLTWQPVIWYPSAALRLWHRVAEQRIEKSVPLILACGLSCSTKCYGMVPYKLPHFSLSITHQGHFLQRVRKAPGLDSFPKALTHKSLNSNFSAPEFKDWPTKNVILSPVTHPGNTGGCRAQDLRSKLTSNIQ